jgi:hypothetical protein
MAAGLSPEQFEQLLATVMNRLDDRQAPPPPPPEHGENGQWSGNGAEVQFRPEEVGFFDPHLAKEFGAGDMVQAGKDVLYRDVQLFVSRARSIADSKGPEGPSIVRRSLEQCLRGAALMWHTHKLTDFEKEALRGMGQGLEQWEAQLYKRFREARADGVKKMVNQTYTVADARNWREPTEFLQTLLKHARSGGIESTRHQLDIAWSNLDPELQREIPEPTETTSISEFQALLDRKKTVWFRIYGRSGQGQGGQTYPSTSVQPPRPQPPGRNFD